MTTLIYILLILVNVPFALAGNWFNIFACGFICGQAVEHLINRYSSAEDERKK